MLQFLGRLHPLVVHFPIALVLVAAFLQLLRGRRVPSETIVTCLRLGAVSAVVAAGCGWLYAEHDGPGSSAADLLFWHRWTGVAGAVLGVLVVFLAQRARASSQSSTAYLAVLGLSVLGIGGGAHLGGELVYGEGYLFEPLFGTEERERPREVPPAPAPKDEVEVEASSEQAADDDLLAARQAEEDATDTLEGDATPDAGADLFATHVLPLFEASCFDCHGPTGRAKAGLRLHTEDALFEGDPDLWSVLPGDPDASFLVELISLPEDDDDLMPPGGPRLSDEEIERVRAWIAAMPARAQDG